MHSPSHRLYGLGVSGANIASGYNSPWGDTNSPSTPSRRSAPAQITPTRIIADDDDIPPSPAPYPTTPQRFRIANPDPPTEEEEMRRDAKPTPSNLQAQAARSFALRPTHSARPTLPQHETSSSVAANGNSLAPASQAPGDHTSNNSNSNSHLVPLDNNRPSRHVRGLSEPLPEAFYTHNLTAGQTPDKLPPNNGNGLKSSSRQIRPSRSSEFLKRLRPASEEPRRISPSYQPVSDDELDEDERLRFPPDTNGGMRATNSPARTLAPPAPQGQWSGSAERIANDFPAPPQQIPELQTSSAEGSADTFATARMSQCRPTSSDESLHSFDKRAKGIPWPMAAKGVPSAPTTTNPLLSSHSENQALFAAETGGMVMLNNASRTYSPGAGPGQTQRLPDHPPVPPAATRHQHRKSTGDLHLRQQPSDHAISTNSPRRQEFPRQRNTPTPPTYNTPSGSEKSFGTDGGALRRRGHVRSNSDGIALLARQGTLFHPASNDARASMELDVMLGKPKSRRLSATSILPAPETPKKAEVRLEASKKSRARVELDVVIERECVVEGGELRGRLEVVVRGGKRGNGLRVGAGKLRVLGYEELVDGSKVSNKHIFYQHQYLLPEFFDGSGPFTTLFNDEADEEGFHLAKEGTHAIPFSMQLPVGGGAKGAFTGEKGKGPNIRYVVVGSVKLHIPKSGKRAIAHFYRPIVLLPYHNPARVLAPSRSPIVEFAESRLGWSLTGEKGKVFLQVSLGRQTWVAGQRVWCEVGVRNNSNKKITKCALAILQTVNTFGVPKGKGNTEFLNMTRKKVSEELNEADFMDVGSGHVTSKSWWTGLEPGESNRWDMSVPIPTGMISIPRSKLVEISYILRVTLNNSIYIDVPVELINFLSVDPPPMPSDARRAHVRMAVSGPAGTVKANIASTLPPASMMSPPVRPARPDDESPMHQGHTHRGLSVPLGIGAPSAPSASGYTTEQLKGEPQGAQQAARSSSTTLDLEALLAQGRARAAEENAHLQVPTDGTDMMPRPISPGSKYSSINTIIPGSAVSTIKERRLVHKVSGTFSEAGSIDDEERNRFAVEAHRRDGREKSLAVIETEGGVLERLNSPIPDEADVRDEVSVIHSSLAPDEIRTYKPAEEPSGQAFEFDNASDDESHVESAPLYERSTTRTPRLIEQKEELASASEDDRTPMASPLTTPSVHPIAKFLHHISEEEEPITDDMLDDMVSLDEESGGLRYLDSTDDDDDDDDLVADDGADATPRGSMAYDSRRSLEERLARACGGGAVVSTAKTAVIAEAREFSPNMNKHGFSPALEHKEFGARPKSIDYTEPLDIDNLTLTSMAPTEPDDGYEAMSEQSSIASRSHHDAFRKHKPTYSLPSGWNPYADTEPPRLPPPSSARDISWGGNLAGRTVSGATAMISLESDSDPQSPRPNKFGARAHSPSKAYSPPRDTGVPQMQAMAMAKLFKSHSAEGNSDEDLRPPDALRRVDTGPSTSSFHTAHSDGDGDMPALKRSSDSESSEDLMLESPPTVMQPVYTTPLPVPPGNSHRASLTIPDRFRPSPNPGRAMSEESHTSVASSSHESAILPAVKARVAQFEHREEALRKFTVASSAGLHSPTSSLAPLSPVHTSSGSSGSHSGYGSHGTSLATSSLGHGSNVSSPSKRRSYTSALAPRIPGAYMASPRSQTSFNLETPHATGEFAQLRVSGTPTSSVSSVRRAWEIREENELSGSASKLLSRALSNSSTSTTATDIERALSPSARSPIITPRGPRPPVRKAAPLPITTSQQKEHDPTRDSGSTVSMNSSELNPPEALIFNPTYRGSPALTPTREQAFLPDVMSETASLEDIGSLDSHKSQPWTTDEELPSSGSEFGNTHWAGGNVRLPPLQHAVPMPAFGPNGPRTPTGGSLVGHGSVGSHGSRAQAYGYGSTQGHGQVGVPLGMGKEVLR